MGSGIAHHAGTLRRTVFGATRQALPPRGRAGARGSFRRRRGRHYDGASLALSPLPDETRPAGNDGGRIRKFHSPPRQASSSAFGNEDTLAALDGSRGRDAGLSDVAGTEFRAGNQSARPLETVE